MRQLPQDLVPRHDGWSGPLLRRSARQAELPLHRPSTTAQILAALPHQLSCRLDSQELNKTFTTVNCLRVLHAMFANGAIVTGGRRCSGSRSANQIAASPSRKELKSDDTSRPKACLPRKAALSDRSDEKGEDCARMLTARFRLIPPLTALERSSQKLIPSCVETEQNPTQ